MNIQKINKDSNITIPELKRKKLQPHTTHSWKQKVLQSCFAILWLWTSMNGYTQNNIDISTSNYSNLGNPSVRLCNKWYIQSKKWIYEVTAKHCKSGLTGSKAVNKDDILYTKISSLPFGARVSKILNETNLLNGSLNGKTVKIDLCVYNMEWEIGQNRYCKPFDGIAHYDEKKQMYYVEIPTEMKRWYSENVSEFWQFRMKSASWSIVEQNWKLAGVVSGIGYNPHYNFEIAGFKPFEARFYFAPAKKKYF